MHVTRVIGMVNPPFSSTPALPPYVRPSVATLSAQQIASLRNGIQVMMSRNAIDATSYRFQANIHGTLDAATSARELIGWNQCEHGSYYFFSWHRMYLYFFERILRAASGDPNLALPYWNWSDPSQRALPQPFWQPQTGNPLYIPPSYTEPDGTVLEGRPAGVDAGTSILSGGTVDFSVAFADTNFDSPAGNGLSFGGQIASPTQFNSPHGALESQPHDVVHVALSGLMGDPDTAAQDPIFWLHHANIDRLWNHWIAQGGGRQDPTDAAWLNTIFTFFDENGTAVQMSGQQIVNTVAQLGYRYDDDQQPTPGPQGQIRNGLTLSQAPIETSRHELNEQVSQTSIPLLKNATKTLNSELRRGGSHRVILQISDIQYQRSPGVYYEMYLDLPKGGSPSPNSPNFIGNLSFFALKPHHAMPNPSVDASDGGKSDFDVTKVVATLLRQHQWNKSQVTVTFVPKGLVDKEGRPVAITPGERASLGAITLSLD
jgi:Common central domain of tyrosinase/Polyphenol oxidase middle domain